MTECNRVWSKFSNKSKNGEQLNFIIREWPIEQTEKVLEFLLKYFVPSEALHKAAGISENAEALKEYLTLVSEVLKETKHDILVCCLENDTEGDNIIAVSLTNITKKGETIPELEFETKEMKSFMKIVLLLQTIFNETKSLAVEEYYGAKGVCVSPDYRGLGIAQEILRVRRLICKELNLPFTCALMTAIGTQKAAARDGWETDFELDVEKLGHQTDTTFKNAPPTFKFMIGKP